MKLEEEIKTRVPFENAHQKVAVNLVYTYNVFLDHTLKVLKEFNVNDQHYNILKVLGDTYPEPLSVGVIKETLFNKRGDLTRLLDKLRKIGLITRDINPANRRIVNIALSEKGKERLKEMDIKLAANRNDGKNLSEKEAKQLNDLLDKWRS